MEVWNFSSFKDYVALRDGTLLEMKFCKEKIEVAFAHEELCKASYEVIPENVI